MKVPAFRIKQGRQVIYLTAFEAKQFLKEGFTAPDAWSPTNRQGYQREPKQRRFKRISEYLTAKDRNALLPQAILLNSREKLTFRAANGDGHFGTLEIKHLPLWEVDGQHRLGGIRVACQTNPDEMEDFMVPVVITEGVPRIEEAVLFFVINTEQKRVPTDLAQRIITEQVEDAERRKEVVSMGKEWIARATEVVDLLIEKEGNPWYERIAIPGLKQASTLIKQVSFVQSLQPILDAERNPAFAHLKAEDSAELLARYWEAVRDTFPEAFEDHKNYVITRTVGVFPLHKIAPAVFTVVRDRCGGRVTKAGLKEVWGEIGDALKEKFGLERASEFWNKDPETGEAGKYAGAKGFKILADILITVLPQEEKVAAVL